MINNFPAFVAFYNNETYRREAGGGLADLPRRAIFPFYLNVTGLLKKNSGIRTNWVSFLCGEEFLNWKISKEVSFHGRKNYSLPYEMCMTITVFYSILSIERKLTFLKSD